MSPTTRRLTRTFPTRPPRISSSTMPSSSPTGLSASTSEISRDRSSVASSKNSARTGWRRRGRGAPREEGPVPATALPAERGLPGRVHQDQGRARASSTQSIGRVVLHAAPGHWPPISGSRGGLLPLSSHTTVRTVPYTPVQKALPRRRRVSRRLIKPRWRNREVGRAWFMCEAPEFHQGPRPL